MSIPLGPSASTPDPSASASIVPPVPSGPEGPATNVWTAAVQRNPQHAQAFAERWRRMAAAGQDIVGEARLIDAMAGRGARILDAGCGTGRIGGYLAAAGHEVVGVDLDPELIAVAEADHPGSRWEVQDLATLDLRDEDGQPLRFDLQVSAGNVMTFLALDERRPALERLAAHLAADGRLVVGFGLARGYSAEDFAADTAAAGLRIQQRFASWDLRPADDDFLVAVLVHG
ncbi:class I SAM-dependent methyltransferase [Brachybacterium sp. DNPG3]